MSGFTIVEMFQQGPVFTCVDSGTVKKVKEEKIIEIKINFE